MLDLDRQDEPPEPGPEMPIIRLRACQKIHVLFLSPQIWGVNTHWNGEKSCPCMRDHSRCSGCKAHWPRRWKGYLDVIDNGQQRRGFFELTPTSALAIKRIIPLGETLRGVYAWIERLKGDRARLRVEVETWKARAPEDKLPAPMDPFVTLSKLWRLNDGAKQINGDASRLLDGDL